MDWLRRNVVPLFYTVGIISISYSSVMMMTNNRITVLIGVIMFVLSSYLMISYAIDIQRFFNITKDLQLKK